ncbi:MAG: DUF255 domain-containing protein [Bacillota bacterium]|nr:DUF255 domain-containing protein [Bacillota bacterium]
MNKEEGSLIKWYEWGEEAFKKAQKEDKPILLSISGSWCHWCHVMDNTTYADGQIIQGIGEQFIPIRVNTDRRPDINGRYNLGGWPTTAFLTPEGDIITGGTYIPPENMMEIMNGVSQNYREDPEGIKKEARKNTRDEVEKVPPSKGTYPKGKGIWETETFADLLGFASSQVKKSYDSEYGGFGNFPKFPMFESLELTQTAYIYQGDKEWKDIFTHSLRSMYSGGIYDSVEGGFFRYSTTRDWSVPHYEKMLEDNARLLSLLLNSCKITGDMFFAEASRDVLRYLENYLYLPETSGWAGSQDADEEYYSLPLNERKQREKPRVDLTVYVNWNAALVRSLFFASVILGEAKWHDHALATLKFLRQSCFMPHKGMAHYLAPGEKESQVWGLLEDQAAVGLALTSAYQHTAKIEHLDMARELADYCLDNLSEAGGAFRDRPMQKEEQGKLAQPLFDIQNNSLCANWFVEMAALTGEEAYLEKAADIIHAFMDEYREHTLFSAGLALASLGVRERGVVIDVVGHEGDPALLPLHSTALAALVHPKVVRLIDPATAMEMGKEEYSKVQKATAYACLGKHCFEPVSNPKQLEQVIEKMVKERRAHVLFTVKESAKV